ncbi:CBS domain-containing protein CBSCBSPB3-like [Panicum virgatum]|nr:CBS domain-containing protein CBSCBSPB3-like [Panicum virgatum]
MMQKFWNSALALEPPDEDFDSHSDLSLVTPSEAGDGRSSMYPPAVGNSFVFKLRDQNGRLHRFTCGSKSLDELISSIMQRLGIGGDKSTVQLLYEDDEGDKVLLTTDSDLAGAVLNAKSSRLKALKLHIDDSDSKNKVAAQQLSELEPSHGIQLMDVHYGLMTCPPEGRSFIKEESCCHNVEVEHQLCLSHLKTCYVVFIVVADYRSAMCCSFILNLYSCSCN